MSVSFRGTENYVASPELMGAVDIAVALQKPLLIKGEPGTGKTMLASRIPGIMSPLNETEQLEVASIRSLCGTLPGYGISDVPPFEAPHHTCLLYTSPSPRDISGSRMPSSA